jgi:hypothetical protein
MSLKESHNGDTGGSNLMIAPQKPKGKLGRRVLGWSAAFIVMAGLALIGWLEAVAHRPSPVHSTITPAEITAEDMHLRQLGLILRDGSFLKEHPFEPPWTSHSLLIPESWSEPGIKALLGPRHVRADLLLADLDVLEPVMERAYGGWDSAAARGWNWDQWFAGWRRQLAARGTAELSFNDAFAPMDALLALQRDNHTQIPLNRKTSDGSQTAILASAPTADCVEIRAGGRLFSIAANDAGQHVRTAKLWTSGAENFTDAHYISMPGSYGTPQAVRCGEDWIPLQPIGDRPGNLTSMLSELWAETLGRDQARGERLGNGVVYARLPTFEGRNYSQVPSGGWPKHQPGDRVLVVDMRDNGGGDAGYGLEVLKGLVDESRMVHFDQIGSQIISSCLYAPLKWSYPSPNEKKRSQELLDIMARPYPPGCPRAVDTTPSRWTYLQHHFEPWPGEMRIIALVNSRCGSDCELLTEMLASLPETIVVGANTYGLCQLIQPGYSVLPHTGLRYRIALGRSDPYGDNRSVDGYGLDVDVVLPQVDSLKPEQMIELADLVAKQ